MGATSAESARSLLNQPPLLLTKESLYSGGAGAADRGAGAERAASCGAQIEATSSITGATGHIVRLHSLETSGGYRDLLCCGLFQEGSATGIPELDKRLFGESLSQKRFTFGLINLIVMSFVMGRWPEHVWLVYGIKLWIYIPLWYYRVVTKRKGYWFIIEPCWAINCAVGVYLALSFFRVLDTRARIWAFEAFFQASLGFLGWSVLVSKNVMVFHSLTTISAILIHLVPTIVCLFLRWQRTLGVPMEEVWPDVFPTVKEMETHSSVGTLFLRGAIVYGIWWIVYTVWLLTIGLSSPERGLPTIYHNYRRKNLSLFKKIAGENMRSQAVAFMAIHFVLVALSFLWAALCFRSFYVHVLWVLFLAGICLWRGSDYYAREVFMRVFRTPLMSQEEELRMKHQQMRKEQQRQHVLEQQLLQHP